MKFLSKNLGPRREGEEPSKADIERIAEKHLARSLGLRLSLGRENRGVGATLDAALLVPCALPVPHQNHPLRLPDRRELGDRTPDLRPHVAACRQPLDLPQARA